MLSWRTENVYTVCAFITYCDIGHGYERQPTIRNQELIDCAENIQCGTQICITCGMSHAKAKLFMIRSEKNEGLYYSDASWRGVLNNWYIVCLSACAMMFPLNIPKQPSIIIFGYKYFISWYLIFLTNRSFDWICKNHVIQLQVE